MAAAAQTRRIRVVVSCVDDAEKELLRRLPADSTLGAVRRLWSAEHGTRPDHVRLLAADRAELGDERRLAEVCGRPGGGPVLLLAEEKARVAVQPMERGGPRRVAWVWPSATPRHFAARCRRLFAVDAARPLRLLSDTGAQLAWDVSWRRQGLGSDPAVLLDLGYELRIAGGDGEPARAETVFASEPAARLAPPGLRRSQWRLWCRGRVLNVGGSVARALRDLPGPPGFRLEVAIDATGGPAVPEEGAAAPGSLRPTP